MQGLLRHSVGLPPSTIILSLPANQPPSIDSEGFCEKTPRASKTGVKVESAVAIELGFSVDGELGAKIGGQIFERTIFVRFSVGACIVCAFLSARSTLKLTLFVLGNVEIQEAIAG
jgi:hypothetical protein